MASGRAVPCSLSVQNRTEPNRTKYRHANHPQSVKVIAFRCWRQCILFYFEHNDSIHKRKTKQIDLSGPIRSAYKFDVVFLGHGCHLIGPTRLLNNDDSAHFFEIMFDSCLLKHELESCSCRIDISISMYDVSRRVDPSSRSTENLTISDFGFDFPL